MTIAQQKTSSIAPPVSTANGQTTTSAARHLISAVSRLASSRRVFGMLLLSIVLSFFVSVFQTVAPILFSKAIDIFSESNLSSREAILLIVSSMAAYGISKLLVEQRWLVYQPAENQILNNVREVYLQHAIALPLQFHLNRSIGRLDSIVGQGMGGIQTLTNLVFTQISPLVFEIIVTILAIYAFVEWSVAVLIFITLAGYLVALVFGAELVSRRLKNALGASIEAQGVSGDAVLNAEGIKTLAIEDEIIEKYRSKLARAHGQFRRFYSSRGILGLCLSAILVLGFTGSLWIVVSSVVVDQISVGALVLTNVYLLQLFRTMESLSYSYRDTRQSLEAVKRFLTIFAEEKDVAQEELKPVNQIDEIEMQRVGFRYPDGRWAVRGATLTITRGHIVALLGESGSGKSTLIRMVLKMLTPVEGIILINGADVQELDGKTIRKKISVVPQDAVMFRASLMFNVALTEQPNHKLLKRSLEAAELGTLLDTLPEGVNTEIGERGLKLSGGERQRLAIARAIYRGAELFIFDEVTSALDEETKAEILQLIRGLIPEFGVLLITHDHSVAEIADSVCRLIPPRSNKIS